uniref:Uncharacterized protein n=1 Tax=Lepeophtheirus salmonis TaxID=72036 RepID=A0A0K2UTI9_LEPSM
MNEGIKLKYEGNECLKARMSNLWPFGKLCTRGKILIFSKNSYKPIPLPIYIYIRTPEQGLF